MHGYIDLLPCYLTHLVLKQTYILWWDIKLLTYFISSIDYESVLICCEHLDHINIAVVGSYVQSRLIILYNIIIIVIVELL